MPIPSHQRGGWQAPLHSYGNPQLSRSRHGFPFCWEGRQTGNLQMIEASGCRRIGASLSADYFGDQTSPWRLQVCQEGRQRKIRLHVTDGSLRAQHPAASLAPRLAQSLEHARCLPTKITSPRGVRAACAASKQIAFIMASAGWPLDPFPRATVRSCSAIPHHTEPA
jgi:hypothetical protein